MSTTLSPSQGGFFKRHGQKLVAGLFWLLVTGAYFVYTSRNGLSPFSLEGVRPVVDFLGQSRWGPLLFVGLYVLRPLVLFSSVLLTLAAGALFGAVWGVVYTVVGSNLGATLAYYLGRVFGKDTSMTENKRLGNYVERMRKNSFETVFIMRLIFLPYDLVNYLAGFLKINYGAFILATALGALPGTVSVALLGASAGMEGGRPSFDGRVLLASVGIFTVSIIVSRLIKRREA